MNPELNLNTSAFFSQSTETLYSFLAENLFASDKPPFLKRILLVPSPLMKNWLTKMMADRLGISMGLEIFLQEQGLKKIADYVGLSSSHSHPSVDQLDFAFQLLIPRLAGDFPFLQNYLDEGHPNRRLSLSRELADHFLNYETFGNGILDDWSKNPNCHWQAALWNLLRAEFPEWKTLHELYSTNEKKPKIPLEIHLFAISYLPPIAMRFLSSLPVKIYFYHLSPTQTFWEDTLSAAQRRFLCKVWEEKGASDAQLDTLNTFLRDTHPLLANWGKLGRMMVKQLPAELEHHEELYPLPEQVFQDSEWRDLTYPETTSIKGENLTLLKRLQADLVTMRPIPPEPSSIEYDESVQVHQAPCKRREIEEIYNIIAGIIHRHSSDADPITPQDVVVMAPEIMDYAPYIQAYFERDESVLDYRLMDVSLPSHDPCIKAFRKILSLIHSRWESTTLIDLLHMELFQKKIGIEPEGVSRIQKWIEDTDVIWGMDKRHHAESLTMSHCPKGVEVHQGTWQDFIERTLSGLFTAHDDSILMTEEDILPYAHVDINDAELLGKWVQALKNLFSELKALENTEASLLEWSQILEALTSGFLDPLSEQLELLFHQLRQAAIPFSHHKFPFDAVRNWFETAFEKGKICYREHHINSVRFCSLLPMRAIPAKVVILCGMNDEAFPRTQIETSLNLMKGNASADPQPKKIDFDRYLMLETILSTRNYLIFTYSVSEPDQGPSLVINELQDLFDRYYTASHSRIASMMTYVHPFQRYSPEYFQGSRLNSYSKTAYHEALAELKRDKLPLTSFIERFELLPNSSEFPEEHTVTLADLELLAKDPIGFYYRKTLGIKIKKEEETQSERLLSLSPLNTAIISRNALAGDLSKEILISKKMGQVPEGIFETLASRTLEIKNEKLHSHLINAGADPKEFFDYTFDHLPFHPENMPKTYVSGTIKNISSEGLILHKEGKTEEDFYPFLPRILFFLFLVKNGALDSKPQVIFSETGIIHPLEHANPKEQIETYLSYWHEAKQSPSPLTPKWIPYLKDNDGAGLEKHLNDTFAASYSPFDSRTKNFDIDHLMNSEWVAWIRRLYDPIV